MSGFKELFDKAKESPAYWQQKNELLRHELQQTKDMLFAVTAVCNGSSAMEYLDQFRAADTMLQESEKEKFRAALDEITRADGTPTAPKHVSRSAIIQIAKNALAESV